MTPPAYNACDVTGMPQDVDAQRALLLTHVPPSSPLAQAGLQASDLVLAVDGTPVADTTRFRERIEARTPGETTTLDVWRDGRRMRVPVVVGRETYERIATFGLVVPIPTNLRLDLWPFDDGIDVLGLVTARRDARRHDLEVPERTYLRTAVPGQEALATRQEMVDVRVFPIAVGTGVRVHTQEALPAGAPAPAPAKAKDES
ncbi:MAG: PDZ domain-containing protein [Planctomycetota bacterium]|nr:PDZ domain-containing protein [Planctomycetota bacterium]